MKYLLTLLALTATLTVAAQEQSEYDLNSPFGFCTVSSRTDASSTYNITGGGCYTYPIPDGFTGNVIPEPLTATGNDMRSAIISAINNYDVIIFDGSKGDFIISKSIDIEGIKNKTLIGINNARLCTNWYLTEEIRAALDEAEVLKKSTASDSKASRQLPNGQSITTEEREFYTRKTIIEQTKDNNENYRKAGIFTISKNSENIIIRNITFQGPGSVDVGGYDLISLMGVKHIWIDHCAFKDGIDGNLDITNSADFNTISWCTFSYTDRSYDHMNTNLVGSSDSEATGYLNTTFAFNWWGPGCKQRMPMARVGKIHMLNNYFSCATGNNCINPRKNSEFLIEGNYIEDYVSSFYSQSGAVAVTWANDNYTAGQGKPDNIGSTVTVPYTYDVAPYTDIPTTAKKYAGAKLKYGDITEPTVNSFITWPFNTGAEGQKANLTGEAANGIESATVTLGAELAYNGKVTTSGQLDETKIKQTNTSGTTPTEANTITFSVTPKSGYTLQVTHVEFTATRIGTDKGKLDAKWIDANGSTTICTGATPKRNNTPSGKADESPFYTTFDIDLDGNATTGESKLVINLYDLSFVNEKGDQFKDYGFCNISIEGLITNSTGISTPITMRASDNGATYNLAGQKVDKYYRGIVIKNGRKVLQ